MGSGPARRHPRRGGGTTISGWARRRCPGTSNGRANRSGRLAEAQGKGIIDAFLDLAVEEELETVFLEGSSNVDKAAMAQILTYPNAYIGLSDGGAHVQFHGGYGYSTRLLGYWVRQEGIMSLEQAVRRLTFESASTFGIYDRGLLRPGLAADITIFDPETVNPLPEDTVHDFPAGGWRVRELPQGFSIRLSMGRCCSKTGAIRGPSPDASCAIPSTKAAPPPNGRHSPVPPRSPGEERSAAPCSVSMFLDIFYRAFLH